MLSVCVLLNLVYLAFSSRLYDTVSETLRLSCLHSNSSIKFHFDNDVVLWLKPSTPSSPAAPVSSLGGLGGCSKKSHKVFCKNSQLYILKRTQTALQTGWFEHSLPSFLPSFCSSSSSIMQSSPKEAPTPESQRSKKNNNKHSDDPKQRQKEGKEHPPCPPPPPRPPPLSLHSNPSKCFSSVFYILTTGRGSDSPLKVIRCFPLHAGVKK